MLINGKWSKDGNAKLPTDKGGAFVRQASGFRSWITPDGSPGPSGEGGFAAEPNRYHLFVALSCPWASRTLMARTLKGLENIVSLSIVEPELSEEGWGYGPQTRQNIPELSTHSHLHQLYTLADPNCSGRVTVPVLWDKKRQRIVNNESAEIMRMFDVSFGELADQAFDLYPQHLQSSIDALNERLYRMLNNGVYRAGFATSQIAHEAAVGEVFAMLDELEARVATTGPFLFGEGFTESDIRLFVTLVRFDSAYYTNFKCDLRHLSDYCNLSAYAARVLSLPGIDGTVNFDHIKRGYDSVSTMNAARMYQRA